MLQKQPLTAKQHENNASKKCHDNMDGVDNMVGADNTVVFTTLSGVYNKGVIDMIR